MDRDEILRQGRLYMERYFFGVSWDRLHHIVESDTDDFLHNHPWDFISILLTGGYREETLDGVVEHYAPCVVSRRAQDFHRLTLLDGPMWTFVTSGPVVNTWGFLTDDGFVSHQKYLR